MEIINNKQCLSVVELLCNELLFYLQRFALKGGSGYTFWGLGYAGPSFKLFK